MAKENLTEDQVEEKYNLVQKAKDLGIRNAHAFSLEKLKLAIEDIEKKEKENEPILKDDKPLTAGQKKAIALKNAKKLVRIHVSCNNPNKKDIDVHYFQVGNDQLGISIKRFIPMNQDWVCEQIIYNFVKNRECQVLVNFKDPKTGKVVKRGKLIKEYNVQVLPDFTEEELKQLALDQSSGNRIE